MPEKKVDYSAKVVVTGGCGFIGASVARELVGRGHSVTVADNMTGLNVTGLPPEHATLLRVDLRNPLEALRAFEGADFCVALAARSAGIGYFNTHPGEMLDDNVRILSASFQAAVKHKIKRIIYVSSSCVFDRNPNPVASESAVGDLAAPPPGYPFSKFVGEIYCATFLRQYGLEYVIIRPFNVYGPGEFPGSQPGQSHVVPDLCLKIMKSKSEIEIFGDGLQTRSFTHVSDIAHGIALAIEKKEAANQDFNLGSPRETTVRELCDLLWKICGRGGSPRLRELPPFEADVRRRAVDSRKARLLLGWEPKVELENGLREYVAWLGEQIGMTARA